MVKVKCAYGDIDGLRHYGTTLIATTENGFILTPFYSASSVRAINQWFESNGIDLKLSRKQGRYVLENFGRLWGIAEAVEGGLRLARKDIAGAERFAKVVFGGGNYELTGYLSRY